MMSFPGVPEKVLQFIAAKIDTVPQLEALHRRQLIAATSNSPAKYRYSSDWDPSGELMSEVAGTYRRHLVPLATYIHSRASSAVREFARAFDLKKDR